MKQQSAKPTRRLTWYTLLAAFLLLLLTGIGLLYYSRVTTTITPEDEKYILLIMQEQQVQPFASQKRTYEEEVALIKAVQRAVMRTAHRPGHIPESCPREPADLYERGYGVCYDRSRVIEKILLYNGLRIRHAALFVHPKGQSAASTLLGRQTLSHALTEVRTQKGWMLVDSRAQFIGLDDSGEPVSLEKLRQEGLAGISWNAYNEMDETAFFQNNYLIVYGLYSRHGRFYPPYNFVPDVNWSELVQNI